MARLIRASEVGAYVYCHRAWWLRNVEGLRPGNEARLRAGSVEHSRHGRRLRASQLLLAAGLVLLLVALLAGLAGL